MSTQSNKNKRIGKYHFRLTGKDNLYFKGQHIVCFTPLPKNKLIKNRSILPTFNADRKYYTYAFQLPSSPIENEQQMLEEHHKRASEAEAEHSELWMPKPRSRHKYCGVCRGHYEDYLEHIQSDFHQNHLKTSRYQQFIVQMASSYQSLPRKDDENIIADVTTEEMVSKTLPELVETASLSKVAAT